MECRRYLSGIERFVWTTRRAVTNWPRIVRIVRNWPVFVADSLQFIDNKRLVYFLRNGMECVIRAGSVDNTVFYEVWVERVYNPKGFDIAENDVVLDVGAHIGFFSMLASSLARNGIVYSFEPVPDNYEILERNIRANRIRNVFLVNRALTGTTGASEMCICATNLGSHSLCIDTVGARRLRVRTTSLDDFVLENCIERIDFLKMDCEGSEYDVLFRSSQETMDRIRRISMECHHVDSERNVSAMLRFLRKEGFEVRSAPRSLSSPRSSHMVYAKK